VDKRIRQNYKGVEKIILNSEFNFSKRKIMRHEMRFTGSGGQGIILASVILTEAALIAGFNGVQSQSYGPEARGGVCKAEVIICEGDIGFAKVVKPTFLLALTQSSLDRYSAGLDSDCVIIADSSLVGPKGIEMISLPIIDTAKEKVGKAFVANIVALGAINAKLNIVPFEALKMAVLKYVPKGTDEINIRALEAGAAL